MTETDLLDLLRPHIPRILAAGAAQERERLRTATFSDVPDEDGGAVGFTAADLERFSDYYAADEQGQYPGHIHRAFGCGVKAFADATKLLRRGVMRDGKHAWVWVKRPEPRPAPDGQTATFAWSEDTHPRDDNGRFVSGGDIRRASRDPKKADELRAAVTNPEQRKKLETAIGSAKVPGKEQGLLEGKQTPIFHKEEGREFANLIRGSMVKAVKDGDHGAVDQVLKRAEHMTAIHFSEAKDKARNQILSDFGDVGPDGLAKNPKAVAAANTVSAAFDAATATIKDKYDDWAFSARDMINGDADRSDFDEAYTSVADAYEKAQDSIWDAVQAARDSLGGKEKGYKLGRYFMSEDFSDEPATEGDDLHAAIAQAMIEVAHDAAESGDDPSEELDRLRELLDDPDTLARVMSGEPESEDFAGGSWQEHMHPRGKNGRFLAKDAMEDAKSDPKEAARLRAQVRPEDADKLEAVLSGGPSPGRTRRGAQREAAAKRRAEKVSTREAAEKVIAKLTREGDLKGKVTPEDLHALADHLASGHMTVADLRRTRDAMRGATIRAGFDGGKRKEEMVKALSAYARGEARERGPKPKLPEPDKKAARKKKIQDTVIAKVIEFGGINPNSLRGHYKNLKDAVSNGVPLAVFNTKSTRHFDTMAQELESSGHIRVPENRNSEDYLIDLITNRAHTLSADLSKKHEEALDEHYRLEQEAADHGHSAARIAEVVRLGEESAQAEVAAGDVGEHGEGFDEDGRGDADESGLEGVADDWDFGPDLDAANEPPKSKSVGVARLKEAVDSSPNLTPEQRQRYHAAVDHVSSRLPLAAHARLANHLTGATFHPDHSTVGPTAIDEVTNSPNATDEAKKEWKAWGESMAKRGVTAAGVYNGFDKTIHADGDMDGGPAGRHSPGDRVLSHHVYAHELGHAIDGPNWEISDSPHWKDAFQSEIAHDPSLGKEAPLTTYGGKSPQEGLAEFSRLLYASDVPTDQIRKEFPKASSVFEAHGLWPAERKGKESSLPEVFDRAEKIDSKHHADVLKPDAGNVVSSAKTGENVTSPAPSATPDAATIEAATKTPIKTEGGATGGSAKDLYTVDIGGKKFAVKSAEKNSAVGDKDAAERVKAEVLSGELAKVAGVSIPDAKAVDIGGKPHVVSSWMGGTPLSTGGEAALKSVKPGEIPKMALFDYATGHVDNHLGNYLVGEDGTLHGIDRESSLAGDTTAKDMAYHLDENKLLRAAAGGTDAKMRAMPLPQADVAKMAEVAAGIPGKLTGKAAEAASQRAAVLKQLAGMPNPTVGDLMRLTAEHGDATPPAPVAAATPAPRNLGRADDANPTDDEIEAASRPGKNVTPAPAAPPAPATPTDPKEAKRLARRAAVEDKLKRNAFVSQKDLNDHPDLAKQHGKPSFAPIVRPRAPLPNGENSHEETPKTGLPAILDAHSTATGKAKDAIEAALWNAGVDSPTAKGAAQTKVDPAKLARTMAGAWADLHDDMTPEERSQMQAAMAHAGVSLMHQPGERVSFDGSRHEAPAGRGTFTGDPHVVTRPGVVDDQGRVLVKGKTEPAKSSQSQSTPVDKSTGVDDTTSVTPPKPGADATGGGKMTTALQGSDKQVDWANKIRHEFATGEGVHPEHAAINKKIADAVGPTLNSITSASELIEHRSDLGSHLLSKHFGIPPAAAAALNDEIASVTRGAASGVRATKVFKPSILAQVPAAKLKEIVASLGMKVVGTIPGESEG